MIDANAMKYEPGMSPGIEDVTCPYGCQGEPNITRGSHSSTLLGSFDLKRDPNHHWLECICKACDRPFTKEWKVERVCYSVRQVDKLPRLLRGGPVCFEEYDNDPRKGQCKHSYMKREDDGSWRCQHCKQSPGQPGWVEWMPS